MTSLATRMSRRRALAPRCLAALCLALVGALTLGAGVAASSADATNRLTSATSNAVTASSAAGIVNKCSRSAIDVPSCGVLWGMYSHLTSGHPHYARFEKAMGRRFDIVKDYVDWQRGVTFPDRTFTALAGHGKRIVYVSWNAINYKTKKVVSYKSIADGDWDKSVILPEARHLKAFHQKVFVDFNHEFDAQSQQGKGDAKQYVAAYRHIHRVFAHAGVKNVIWAWVSTGYLGNLWDIKPSWPGSKYVDWVGYDPYNFASCTGHPWRSPYKTFEPFYHWLRTQPGMKHKPILLGEYASAPGHRLKHWYASLAKTLKRLPRIKALFQWSAPTVERCNVSLADSSAALAGFAKSANSPVVTGADHR
jgi:hypothetical protein